MSFKRMDFPVSDGWSVAETARGKDRAATQVDVVVWLSRLHDLHATGPCSEWCIENVAEKTIYVAG